MARAYHSELRRQQSRQTRTRIQDAAVVLFARQGYASTTMRQLAGAAGVSVDTLYSVGGKPSVFLAAFDAVLTDAESAPDRVGEVGFLADTPAGADAKNATDAVGFIVHMTRIITESRTRGAGLWAAFVEGANADPALAKAYREHQDVVRRRVLATVNWLVEGGLIAAPADSRRVADLCWASSHPTQYALLVETAGWTPGQYQEWLAQTHIALLT